MKTYAVKMKNGSVCITQLINDTIEKAILKWPEESKQEIISYDEIKKSDIPKDRYFRSAWDHSLKVDLERARVIHMNNIRLKRNERLKELDKSKYGHEFDEERQFLRDITDNFDLTTATTPEELKSLWPNELKE